MTILHFSLSSASIILAPVLSHGTFDTVLRRHFSYSVLNCWQFCALKTSCIFSLDKVSIQPPKGSCDIYDYLVLLGSISRKKKENAVWNLHVCIRANPGTRNPTLRQIHLFLGHHIPKDITGLVWAVGG